MKGNLGQEYPPKVEAIYKAIIDLLNQGYDVHQLKVSEITKRAGIGKGTAYEYFESKEKMIAGALVYDTNHLLENLYLLEEKEQMFESKLRVILQWFEQDLKESRTFARIVTIQNGDDTLSITLKEEMLQMKHCFHSCISFVDELLTVGWQQGKIRGISEKGARMAIISQMAGLVLCLMHPAVYPDISTAEAAEITYGNIMRVLGVEKTT